MTESNFEGLLTAVNRQGQAEEPPAAPTPGPTPSRKRGRAAGERSSSDYVQITAYIRITTHKAAMLALAEAKYSGNAQSPVIAVLVHTLPLNGWTRKNPSSQQRERLQFRHSEYSKI